MDVKLLIKADDITQQLIKDEAERNLLDLHKSEDLIINKINNFIKYAFAIFVTLTGYCINQQSLDGNAYILLPAIFLVIISGIIILILFSSIFPKKSRLLGSEPDKLVQGDFLVLDKFDKNRIVVNRIQCIQSAINITKESYQSRLESYKNANNLLLVGLAISFISLIVSLLYQS